MARGRRQQFDGPLRHRDIAERRVELAGDGTLSGRPVGIPRPARASAHRKLGTLGVDIQTYLRLVHFRDGSSDPQCSSGGTLAYTAAQPRRLGVRPGLRDPVEGQQGSCEGHRPARDAALARTGRKPADEPRNHLARHGAVR
jgi:hypothetical protein